MSTHFTIAELTHTDTGLVNLPDGYELTNLDRLTDTLLEPIRALLDAPMVIHSGYRSAPVNQRVGGNPHSAHLEGRACDFHPDGVDIHEAFEQIRISDLPYDKILLEHHGDLWWIHVQVGPEGAAPRRKAYEATVTPSVTAYTEIHS